MAKVLRVIDPEGTLLVEVGSHYYAWDDGWFNVAHIDPWIECGMIDIYDDQCRRVSLCMGPNWVIEWEPVASPTIDDRREEEVKKVRAEVQRRLEKKREARRTVVTEPAPRYDEVFAKGVAWLDGMKEGTERWDGLPYNSIIRDARGNCVAGVGQSYPIQGGRFYVWAIERAGMEVGLLDHQGRTRAILFLGPGWEIELTTEDVDQKRPHNGSTINDLNAQATAPLGH